MMYVSVSSLTATDAIQHYSRINIRFPNNTHLPKTFQYCKSFDKGGEKNLQKPPYLLKKQQRPLKKEKPVKKNERKRRKRGQREDCKLSGVRLRKVHPARDVDECASGFKLALQPPAVRIPRLR